MRKLTIQRRWGEEGLWAKGTAPTKAQRQKCICCGEQGRMAGDKIGEVEGSEQQETYKAL